MADDSIERAPLSTLGTENQNPDDLNGVVVDPTGMENLNATDWNFLSGQSGESVGLYYASDEEFEAMIVKEMENLPNDVYLERLRQRDLDVSARRECLEWIWKALTHFGFSEKCFALAVNYYDRFMSVYVPPRDVAWVNQLIAITCLSLAAKLVEARAFRTIDLQVGEPKFIFDCKNILRMELLVLNTLGWKVHVYTPLTFIYHFLMKIGNNQLRSRPLITKAVQIILSTIKGIDFLNFRPCEIAAAVALSVLGKIEAMEIDMALSCFQQLAKDRVLKCVEKIDELKLVSLCSNGNGVLDAQSLMCNEEDFICNWANGEAQSRKRNRRS